jgi:methionine-rich copper-binding protein CopC
LRSQREIEKEKSMKKYLLAIAATAAMTAPAFADYYVVRGPDEKCEVVETVPESYVQVGPLSFGTRDEAQRQVEVICKQDNVVVETDDDDDDKTVIIERN